MSSTGCLASGSLCLSLTTVRSGGWFLAAATPDVSLVVAFAFRLPLLGVGVGFLPLRRRWVLVTACSIIVAAGLLII